MTIIVCKLKRQGGTKTELFGKTYHFKPAPDKKDDPEAPHTCDIPDSDAKALYRLLQIKEAYELADPADIDKLPARPKADPGQTIAGDKGKPAVAAPVIITNGEGKEINLTEMAPEELRALAKDEFKIQVHHKWADQTVIAKIIEKMRGE